MNPHRMQLDPRPSGQIAAHQLPRHRPAGSSKDVIPSALWFRPVGPPFLSPGQRPGYALSANVWRPEGPRYAALSGLAYWSTVYPARWAGLRERGPLGRLAELAEREREIRQGMKELEGGVK